MTSKQENFCQAIVDGLKQSDAYKTAGYSFENKLPATVHQAASRLASNSNVVARVAELQAAVTAAITERRVWDSVRLIDEAEVHMLQAREQKQFAAANGALRLIGQTAGLFSPQTPVANDIKITKVTVVLNHGNRERLDHDTSAIEGRYRVLPSADEAE